MSKKILVVVDVQKDFYHPDGALYVKGGEELPKRIADVIPQFDDVIFTVDWHPYNHCSFIGNKDKNHTEGNWPIHCVAYTEGASLPKEFMTFIYGDESLFGNVVKKGSSCETEEYGADPNMIMCSQDENPEECEFVFCGIHALYCVKETIKNFIEKYPQVKVSVLTDCIAPLDCDEFHNFCIENSITQKSMADF